MSHVKALPFLKKRERFLQPTTLWMSLLLLACLGGMAFFYLQRPFSNKLASFATDLTARSPAQEHNIRLAASKLSNLILKPGEIFSFNEKIGPYSQQSGYQPERSYLYHQTVLSFGGGVCQVSSTLYNAVRDAGLEVLERVPHSGEVKSVPPGWDATLAYGVADLKFKNNGGSPIRLQVAIAQNQLKIEIWGKDRHEHSQKL